jgi:hypothetical protein
MEKKSPALPEAGNKTRTDPIGTNDSFGLADNKNCENICNTTVPFLFGQTTCKFLPSCRDGLYLFDHQIEHVFTLLYQGQGLGAHMVRHSKCPYHRDGNCSLITVLGCEK